MNRLHPCTPTEGISPGAQKTFSEIHKLLQDKLADVYADDAIDGMLVVTLHFMQETLDQNMDKRPAAVIEFAHKLTKFGSTAMEILEAKGT